MQWFFFLSFNWRKIALQCCAGFCCTTMQISHNYTCISSLGSLPPPPLPALRAITEGKVGLPESQSNFSPAVYFTHGRGYMSTLFSPFIALFPSPTCMYNILLSHKKQWIWVSSNKVDETRACYTEWNKLERENKYINAYTWNQKKWYWWTYLQGRNRDADLENSAVTF